MKKEYFHFTFGTIVLVAVWALITELAVLDTFFLPKPLEVFAELVGLSFSGTIVPDVLATLIRTAIAFAAALIVGIPAGLLLGSSKKVYESLEFLIDFFRSLPATAIFPLFLLILGVGDESKIAVAAFGAVLIIIFNTAHGVKHSNKYRHLAAKLMGASKTQIFKTISFWESLPQTFAGIRTAISIALIVVIVTEMFIGTQLGLGRRIVDFQYIYNITGMYAVIILTGMVGYAMNTLFMIAEKKIIHWSGSTDFE